MPIEQIITITSNVTDCGGDGTDTITVPVSVNIDGTVVAVNGVPCNAPLPFLSVDTNGQVVLAENGNCAVNTAIKYGSLITDESGNVLFGSTAAANLADLATTQANINSDLAQLYSGSACVATQSVLSINDSANMITQGGNNVLTGPLNPSVPAELAQMQQEIGDYLVANGSNGDSVTVGYDSGTSVLTITIISALTGFVFVGSGNATTAFTETAAPAKPCAGCYMVTVFATGCDGSGDATVMGNSESMSITPLLHDAGDVYYFDEATPINVSSPFSNNVLGTAVTQIEALALLNGDTNKPAGISFANIVNASDNSGSYVVAVGNACLAAAFIGVEPLPIDIVLVSQTGGQVLNGYVATNPYPTEYNFAYSNDGTNFTPQATWDAVSGNNISHDFGASVFGNGDYVRVCGRYVGGTAVWCEVIRIPTVAVSENINGNGDYVKTIFNQTPDTSRPDVFTDFIETLTISGHNDPAVNGSYAIEVNSTTVTATPALPAGLSITRIDAHTIEVVAAAAFLLGNTGSITIDETDIYGILKHSGDMDMQSVTAATETYSYSALFDCWVSPNIDQAALSFYRNIIVNGVTYNTATYTGSDIALYIAEVLSLGITGLVNAAYVPKKVTISFNSSAAITSVEFEADVQVGTFSVLPFTQTSANQPTSCV